MSIDTHSHVFLRSAQMDNARRYTPLKDATVDEYLAMLDRLGSTHGVLVQPSFLGHDNSFLLSATAAHKNRLRGIVVVQPEIGAFEIDKMAAQGAMGIRLNLIGKPDPDLGSPIWRRHLATLAERKWQVEVQVEAARLPEILSPLIDTGVAVVIDHFGRPGTDLEAPTSGFHHLLDAAATRRVWVKLSAPYRLGAGAQGDALARRAASLLLDSFGPERLLWGSDWPHTEFEKTVDTLSCLRSLDSWVPDKRQRQQILGETPALLFGFITQDCTTEAK